MTTIVTSGKNVSIKVRGSDGVAIGLNAKTATIKTRKTPEEAPTEGIGFMIIENNFTIA